MLTKGAASLVQLFELKTGTLPDPVVKQLEQSETADPSKKYSVAEVEQMLIGAMPDRSDVIQQIAKDASRAQTEQKPGDEKGVSLLEARVKTVNKVAKVPQPPPPVRVDPYEVVFEMPQNTAFVLFFNGRKVDPDGRPAIMGIAARDGHDSKKLDQSHFHVPEGHDVQTQTVKKSATFAKFVEANDSEFRAGDPVIGVALDAKGRFISSETLIRPLNETITEWYPAKVENGKYVPDLSQPLVTKQVATGEALDNERVMHNVDRLAFEVRTKQGFSPPGWWGQQLNNGDAEATMMLKRGFIFEAGASATATWGGTQVETKVEGKDAEVAALPVQLPGSPTKMAQIKLTNTLQQLAMSGVQISTGTVADSRDRSNHNVSFESLVMPYLEGATMAGQALGTPSQGTLFADVAVKNAGDTAAQMFGVVRRPAKEAVQQALGSPKAQTIEIQLDHGFLAFPNRDLKGMQIEVGYLTGPDWTPVDRKKLGAGKASSKLQFEMNIANPAELEKAGTRLEIRAYTAEGLPLKRVTVPFNQTLQWAPDVFE